MSRIILDCPKCNKQLMADNEARRRNVICPYCFTKFDGLFGFPVCSYEFRLRGQKYAVGPSGVRTLKLLHEIHDGYRTSLDRFWALSFRDQIRKIRLLDKPVVLALVAERTKDATVRILAIWLRGRCGGKLGTHSLARFSTHSDDATRKEVARAFKRMGAWAQLADMANNDSNERIRRLASVQPPRNYADRLADFASHVPRLSVNPTRGRLYVSPGVDFEHGKLPKSPSLIRAILVRIRYLIRGSEA